MTIHHKLRAATSQAAGGGDPWTPDLLASYDLHWDADDSTSITLSTGDVTAWASQVGSVTVEDDPGTSQWAEVLSAELNSMDVVSFGGQTDEFLVNNVASLPSGAITLAAVFRAASVGSGKRVLNNGGSGGSDNRRYLNAGAIDFGDTEKVLTGVSANTWTIQVGSIPTPGLGITQSAWVDGEATAQTGTVDAATTPASWISIGAYPSGIGPLDVDVAEILVFSEQLSATNRIKLEGYLAHRWGLEGNLPSGHTYKSAAPTT